MLSMVGDVPVKSEASTVTSSISRFAGPTQFLGGAHRGRVCVRAFIGVSVRSCLWASASIIGSDKKSFTFVSHPPLLGIYKDLFFFMKI
jgi:hypothetical protein